MRITHLSAECYPAAKAGGLGDVLGSLPKYLIAEGIDTEVIIPKYDTKWFHEHEFETVFEARARLSNSDFHFKVQTVTDVDLGFPFYCIDIPGRFDRPGIYLDPWSGHGYWDELERNITFQIAALDFIKAREEIPDVIHCHDHQTGIVSFMMKYSYVYDRLKHIPSIITVHNAEYHGVHDHTKDDLLPHFDVVNKGKLDWAGKFNSLATALKESWSITTVSQNYMSELGHNSAGLESIFRWETGKSRGILNGIDTKVWDPTTDPLIEHNYTFRNRKSGKAKNKEALCNDFKLNPELPTIAFIGRLVREKGADLIPDLVKSMIYHDKKFNFIVLGTGNPWLHDMFQEMNHECFGYFDSRLEYNEKLAHQIYAGSDFIFMPSRVEPCGLNQMFAMRYGTIPIVRTTGGLKDTVLDLSEENGYGLRFDEFSVHEAETAVGRAIDLFNDKKLMAEKIAQVMKLDFSWEKSAKEYIQLYNELLKN